MLGGQDRVKHTGCLQQWHCQSRRRLLLLLVDDAPHGTRGTRHARSTTSMRSFIPIAVGSVGLLVQRMAGRWQAPEPAPCKRYMRCFRQGKLGPKAAPKMLQGEYPALRHARAIGWPCRLNHCRTECCGHPSPLLHAVRSPGLHCWFAASQDTGVCAGAAVARDGEMAAAWSRAAVGGGCKRPSHVPCPPTHPQFPRL